MLGALAVRVRDRCERLVLLVDDDRVGLHVFRDRLRERATRRVVEDGDDLAAVELVAAVEVVDEVDDHVVWGPEELVAWDGDTDLVLGDALPGLATVVALEVRHARRRLWVLGLAGR